MTEGLAFEAEDGPQARIIGTLTDIDGDTLSVGVCGGQVLIGSPGDILGLSYPLSEVQCEEFAQLFVRAQWEAARHTRTPAA